MTKSFAAIWAEAEAAGAAAGAAVVPAPMVVMGGKTVYHVSEGACGFGWVEFPGNTAFGKWAKAKGIARKGYPKGLSVWSKLLTQSVERNAAWARAVASVLSKYGIAASAMSRLD